jgi:hypothetical protein
MTTRSPGPRSPIDSLPSLPTSSCRSTLSRDVTPLLGDLVAELHALQRSWYADVDVHAEFWTT